ncbi:MAG: thioredoxin family protein [Rhodospirillales bacterium]|nr:thioredoxin family protein [Alphaproteobacteria bacterium]MCB9986453.1 thioredoxin family protein [Rhodospirillales bacterium]USO07001.1 MAG: thioredoxin family protein [Rhodospirillales bacterium]
MRLRRLFCLYIYICLCLLCAANPARAQDSHVALDLFANTGAAVPGQVLHLAVRQTIAPDWHTYWVNPGDSGEAMRLDWTLPPGYAPSELQWPAPRRVPYGPLMNFGYTDTAVMLADLLVPPDARPGDMLKIEATAQVLVCDEICTPETHDLALDLPVAATAQPANKALFEMAGRAMPLPVGWPVETNLDDSRVRVRITLPPDQAGIAAGPDTLALFPLEYGYMVNAAPQTVSYDASARRLTIEQARDTGRDLAEIDTAAYVLRAGDQAWRIDGPVVATPPALGLSAAVPSATAQGMGLALTLVFALAGGLILNLMPCVFPVLSMKALHLVEMHGAERRAARLNGVLYALGVVIMFVALGALLLALRAGGESIGWGFQLQNPVLVAMLAWLMFVIGLNLAGVFDLRIAFGGSMLLAEEHHPRLTAFLTGVLATLVATPCSAPFMAGAVGVALTRAAPVALLIFATLGLGLALPFLALSLVPVLQKILPRPGAWMETLRQLLAFPMFASAVWLVWVVAQQAGPDAVGWTGAGMCAIALAIWLFDRPAPTRKVRAVLTLLGFFAFALALCTLIPIVPRTGSSMSISDDARGDARPFTPAALDDALATGAPVFVNMSASWCITCLVNERMTLSTRAVRALFDAAGVVSLRGDWTGQDPAITAYLQRFGRSGVPLYVLYPAPKADGPRPAPVILPQILTRAALETALNMPQESGHANASDQ